MKSKQVSAAFWTLLSAAAALLGATPARGQGAAAPTEIDVTDVRVSRRSVRPGGVVRVSLTLRNQGPVVARSRGASTRTIYVQGQSFERFGARPRPGRYSVVMTLSGPRGHAWPYRWGLGGDLKLGQIRRVSYPLRLTTPGIYTIFVGVAAGDRVRQVGRLTGVEVVAPGRRARVRPNLVRATPPARITVNGKEVSSDQRPVFYESEITVSNEQILVPIRFVAEELGARVRWEARTRTAHIRRGEYDMRLRAGRREHVLNGEPVSSHTPLRVIGGRTMVPVRFVSQAMGGTVNWDNRTRTVAITLPDLAAR